MDKRPNENPQRLLLSVKRFAWEADISPRSVWTMLASGKIRGVKVLRRTLIPRRELERLAR